MQLELLSLFPLSAEATSTMPFETEYKLEDVEATRIASDAIDGTFRSTTIGKKLFIIPGVSDAKTND